MAAPTRAETRLDAISGLVWMLFGAVVVVGALRMDSMAYMGATTYTAPGFVPGLLGTSLALLGAILTIRARRGGGTPWLVPGDGASLPRALAALAMLLVFAVGLVGRVPFWLATGLFVTVFVLVFELWGRARRDVRALAALGARALACGVATAVAVTVVFERVFLVRLP